MVAVSLDEGGGQSDGTWAEVIGHSLGGAWTFGLGCGFIGSRAVWPIITSTSRGEGLVHASEANGWAILQDDLGGLLAFRVWVQHAAVRVWARGNHGELTGILIDLDLIDGLQPSTLEL